MLSTLNLIIFYQSSCLNTAVSCNLLKLPEGGGYWQLVAGLGTKHVPSSVVGGGGLWAGLQAVHQTRSPLGQAESCSSPNMGPYSPGGWLWLATAWSAGQAPYSMVSKHALHVPAEPS
jgi:hypothetical protein